MYTSSPPRTAHLLIIDDDDIDAMAVERSLKKSGMSNPIHRAVDGEQGLAMLRGEGGYPAMPRPVLILLDLNMPRMNGLEFLEALRADPQLQDHVVFVMTTSEDEQDRLKAYRNHVAGYVVKHRAGAGFMELTQLLDHYWRIVELPS